MDGMQVTMTLEASFHREGDVVIAAFPALDIASQGADHDEAAQNLIEAAQLFFESCFERGVLTEVLKSLGFEPAHGRLSRTTSGEHLTVPPQSPRRPAWFPRLSPVRWSDLASFFEYHGFTRDRVKGSHLSMVAPGNPASDRDTDAYRRRGGSDSKQFADRWSQSRGSFGVVGKCADQGYFPVPKHLRWISPRSTQTLGKWRER